MFKTLVSFDVVNVVSFNLIVVIGCLIFFREWELCLQVGRVCKCFF